VKERVKLVWNRSLGQFWPKLDIARYNSICRFLLVLRTSHTVWFLYLMVVFITGKINRRVAAQTTLMKMVTCVRSRVWSTLRHVKQSQCHHSLLQILMRMETIICVCSQVRNTSHRMKPSASHRPLLVALLMLNPRHQKNTAMWHRHPFQPLAVTWKDWIQTDTSWWNKS